MNSIKYSIYCILMVFLSSQLFCQTPKDVLKEAHELYNRGEYKAVNDLLVTIDSKENRGEIEMLMGDAEHKMDFFDMAIHHYKMAEKSGVKTAELYFHRAAAYISIGEFKKATKDLDKSIGLDSENPELYFFRGYAYTELDKYDQAMSDFSNAILLDADYAEAYYNRGAVRIDMDMLDEGEDDLRKAKKLGGDELNISFNLAIISYEKEEYENAIDLFEELLDTGDKDQKIDAFYYLAECNYQLDDNDAACRYFYKAMELGDLDSEAIYHNYCEKGQLRKLFKSRRKTEKVTF